MRGSLARGLGLQDELPTNFADDALPRLLQSATHLAGATGPAAADMRTAAYRIAVAAWTMYRARYDNLYEVVQFVFGRLGNFPAVQQLSRSAAAGGTAGERFDQMPLPLWLEINARATDNSVGVTATTEITLTDFQRELWTALSSGTATAVSAPTSAGKSYVLQHFLAEALISGRAVWGVYVVPTRALITQVSLEMMALFDVLAPEVELPVLTIPLSPEEAGVSRGVYVLTAERLQALLEATSTLAFDVAIIDEAQSVGDGARGVVLQTVVEKVRRRSPAVRLLFGSPLTRDPETFGEVFAVEQLTSVSTSESPVAQNLVFVDTKRVQRNVVGMRAVVDGEAIPLGSRQLPVDVVAGTVQSLASISWALGREERNLVYASGPKTCEDIANLITQLEEGARERAAAAPLDSGSPLPSVDGAADSVGPAAERESALADFAQFLREHVHPQYLLASTVSAGVAFHYGNMPSTVRKTIEDYFTAGYFSHLVCTSTLLAGVNLPAKNLFLYDPTRGSEGERARKEKPISSVDFWNLAGRAGRLGKEFEGNVFLIDHGRWKADPLDGPREQSVASALKATVVDRNADFLKFASDREHGSGRKESMAAENTFVKLVNDARRGSLSDTLGRVFKGTHPEERAVVAALVEEAASSIRVPSAITERNINVSPFRQDDMLVYLERKISKDGPESVMPLHPLGGDGVFQSLLAVFGRIAKRFERVPGQGYVYYAQLARRWMRGDQLVRLIDDAYEYKRSKRRAKGEPSVASVIRGVMSDVEQHLRFCVFRRIPATDSG